MIKIGAFFSLFIILSFNLHSELHDPFYLSTDCETNSFCSLGKSSIEPLFFFYPAMKDTLDNTLEFARENHQLLSIDISGLPRTCLRVRIIAKSFWMCEPILDNIHRLDHTVSISDFKIKYKLANFQKSDIDLSSYFNYVKINRKNSSYYYWLTPEQKQRIFDLLNNDHPYLVINLSALKLSKPYRDFLSAEQVIYPMSLAKVN